MTNYGYMTDVNQEKFNNKGIFSTSDIYKLKNQDKWSDFGQLELLVTTDVTSNVSTLDFLSIDQYGFYDVFCLILNDITIENNNKLMGLELLSDGTASGTNYQVTSMVQRSDGVFNDVKGTSYPAMRITDNVGSATNEVANSIIYVHNALDDTKYTHINYHGLFQSEANTQGSEFGSGCLPEARMDNGFRFHPDQNGSTNFTGGNFSLYGIEMT